METGNYDFIYNVEKTNWWYSAKRDLLHRILRSNNRTFDNALDIGCGPGANIEALNNFARKVTGLDISKRAIAYSRKKHPHNKFILGTASKLPFADKQFDLVLCSEVIEHVDDKKAIDEVYRIMKPGGLLILTVPAHMKLWNFNDDFNHHLRRYELREVKSLVQGKFNIRYAGYWNFVSYLPARILSKLNRKKIGNKNTNNLYLVPKFMNRLLLTALKLENAFFMKNLSLEGVSVICVAERL